MSGSSGSNWPASDIALDAGRRFLSSCVERKRVVVACHSDADGLTSGLLAVRGLERVRVPHVTIVPTGKAEHVHSESMREKILHYAPDALIVTDMGSRGEHIFEGMPTLVIDHHQPQGTPPGAVMVSAYGCEPIVSSSLLVYYLFSPLVPMDDLKWLALLGAVGDLGTALPFPEWTPLLKEYGGRHVTEAVALLNAARRSGKHEVLAALNALMIANSPADIALKKVPGVDVLQACRDEVQQELSRCLKTAPKFAKNVAMLRFSSPAQIHPLIATRWSRTLRKFIVLAANDNYIPGRVNFSLRTMSGVNLVNFLRELMPQPLEGEYANGHAQATGGSLPPSIFEEMLERIGFQNASAAGLAVASASKEKTQQPAAKPRKAANAANAKRSGADGTQSGTKTH
ncbi:MAG TPA: DHH family phosphoesterase [Planctomycetota bacterium]|nr:DHH family phosphoesterase [Planctomycetota bacterium]